MNLIKKACRHVMSASFFVPECGIIIDITCRGDYYFLYFSKLEVHKYEVRVY